MKNKIIINKIDNYIKPKISKTMTPLEIVNVFCDEYKSQDCKYKSNELKIRIIAHTNRVIKNSFNILKYKMKYEGITFTDQEIEILYIALCFHDIGKIHDKNNHALYSTVITEYLLDNEYVKLVYNKLNNCTKNKILEAIYMHGNKKENRNEITTITKIVRDADTLDENCGESLVDLAISYNRSKGKKDEIKDCNLNKIDYSKSDAIIHFKTNEKYINKIIKKLNDPIYINFYKDQIKLAKELYNKRTKYTRGEYQINMTNFMNEIKNEEWFKKCLEIIIE